MFRNIQTMIGDIIITTIITALEPGPFPTPTPPGSPTITGRPVRKVPHAQRVQVVIWYILRAQRGSHIVVLGPKYKDNLKVWGKDIHVPMAYL